MTEGSLTRSLTFSQQTETTVPLRKGVEEEKEGKVELARAKMKPRVWWREVFGGKPKVGGWSHSHCVPVAVGE